MPIKEVKKEEEKKYSECEWVAGEMNETCE